MSDGSQELVGSAVGGDRDALEVLLRRFDSQLRAGIRIGPEWRGLIELDDIVQVTCIEAFLDILKLDHQPISFLSWLRRIAENNLRDVIKALQCEKRPPHAMRLRPAADQDSVVWLHELVTGTATTPSGAASREESWAAMEAEIEKLPESYRIVVTALFLEGKSVAEVAQQLGRTKGAVHLLRTRALERLREAMGSSSSYF